MMVNKQTKGLSLKAAYSFGAEHGLKQEIDEIRIMSIEWDSSYTSSLRRGYVIELLKRKGIFEDFKAKYWTFGNTIAGEAKCRRYLDIKSRYKIFPVDPSFKRLNVISAVEAIKQKFAETGSLRKIPMLKRGSFTAELTNDGVLVDNLSDEPFLPWATFQEAVCIMIQKSGQASRGDAMRSRLSDARLPMDSIEGHIAHVVYGKSAGDSVFRRITPISCILIWAGVCKPASNQLVLRGWLNNSKDVKVATKAIDWSLIKKEHVTEACNLYDTGYRLPSHPARNTFLLFRNKKYPAKFIRGLAYELATGRKLRPSEDYSGGIETASFLSDVGFEVEFRGNLFLQSSPKISSVQSQNKVKPVGGNKVVGLNSVSQKTALKNLLIDRYGRVETEVTFDWLIVPSSVSMDKEISSIAAKLTSNRGHIGFFKPGISLKCDFFILHKKYIIEYDERQHFTIPRDISLSLYPDNLNLGFDIKDWRKYCQRIKAKDPDPPYRDEQRAFYDSLRDIFAAQNSYHLIRIKHGNYDWESKEASKTLLKLLK